MSYPIRAATRADSPELRALIALSARELRKDDYRPEQIEGALRGDALGSALRPGTVTGRGLRGRTSV